MIEITASFNEYRLQGVIAFLAVGTTQNGYADIYGTTRPALGGAAGGDPLVRIFFVEPCGTISGGALNVTLTNEYLIENTGSALWARVCNGDDVIGFDCSVSDLAGSGELKLVSTDLYAGGYARISSGTFV